MKIVELKLLSMTLQSKQRHAEKILPLCCVSHKVTIGAECHSTSTLHSVRMAQGLCDIFKEWCPHVYCSLYHFLLLKVNNIAEIYPFSDFAPMKASLACTPMPSESFALMIPVKAVRFMVRQVCNRRSWRGFMFQHTIRTAAYQQSAKKCMVKFKCHDLTLHQVAESTVVEYKSLAQMTVFHVLCLR